MLIPPTSRCPGGSLASTPRDFLLALVIACILTTLFLKAPLIGPLMRRLAIDEPEPVDLARKADLAVYFLLAERAGFQDTEARAVLRDDRVQAEVAGLDRALASIMADRQRLLDEHGEELFERALRLTAVHVEETALKQLYVNGEVGELTYRRLHGKLQLQTESIEAADLDVLDVHRSRDRKDIFDTLVQHTVALLTGGRRAPTDAERIESARAQLIMARRVLRVLGAMQHEFERPVFLERPFERVTRLYAGFDQACTDDLDQLAARSDAALGEELERLAELSRAGWGSRALALLRARGIAAESDEQWLKHRFTTAGLSAQRRGRQPGTKRGVRAA